MPSHLNCLEKHLKYVIFLVRYVFVESFIVRSVFFYLSFLGNLCLSNEQKETNRRMYDNMIK